MSDRFYEQISEFVDDEMSFEESDFFVRRLQRDDSARARYLRYHLIGAAVRGESVVPAAGDFGRRLEQALKDDEVPAPAARPRWARLVSGTGIAASVALAAIFSYMALGPESSETSSGAGSGDQDAPSLAVSESETESGSPLIARAPSQVTGIQYVMHHARYSSGMFRTIMQSNVVAAEGSEVPEVSAMRKELTTEEPNN